MKIAHHSLCACGALGVAMLVASCAAPSGEQAKRADRARGADVDVSRMLAPPAITDTAPRDYDGLHNVVAFADGVYSGSLPEGEAGFRSLRQMGVRTVISVDGAVPEVERAASEGLRYVHLPIGYDGMDEARKMEITRALRDLPGPVYVHCHHGKHRSAAAAGVGVVSLGMMTAAQAELRMHISGTSPKYSGLYACVANSAREDAATIDAANDAFSEVFQTTGLVQGMVEITHAFEHLQEIERAGWQTPSNHPDLVPAAEAGRLANVMRYLLEDAQVVDQPEDFRAWITQSHEDATKLEQGILRGASSAYLSDLLGSIDTTCTACHVKYRN